MYEELTLVVHEHEVNYIPCICYSFLHNQWLSVYCTLYWHSILDDRCYTGEYVDIKKRVHSCDEEERGGSYE